MASANDLTRRQAVLVAVGAAVAALVWLFLGWWSRPPQMGPDERVSQNVDALFTAVTARDEKLLAACEGRLLSLKDAGKLPLEAASHLDHIVGAARAGHWESAAQTLYDFMRAQRREPAQGHARREKGCSTSGTR